MFFIGIFSGELIFGGAYFRRSLLLEGIFHLKIGFTCQQKQLKILTKHLNQSMGLFSGGLIIGRIFASEIWGAYFQEGLFLGWLIIRILRYLVIWRDL